MQVNIIVFIKKAILILYRSFEMVVTKAVNRWRYIRNLREKTHCVGLPQIYRRMHGLAFIFGRPGMRRHGLASIFGLFVGHIERHFLPEPSHHPGQV